VSEILFLSHRIPYPPNKGDKIRSYHLLRHLAQHHTVHLGTFIDDPEDWAHTDTLRALCGECCFVPLNRRSATLRSLRGLVTGEALTLPFYADGRLRRWVDHLARTRKLDAALVYSSAMAQYVESLPLRKVADFVDVDSDKWRQYAAKLSGPRRWIYQREGERLAAYESRIAETFDATFLVSAAEAALMRRIAPPHAAGRIHHFDNGVDTDYFSPERHYENPFPAAEKSIVFTGAMDYWPNVDAVTWFADTVLPIILTTQPAAVFTIVGSRPAEAVRQLGQRDGIRVTGGVPDVRPYLAYAAVAVAPMRIARGVQNKVLEAMAMGKPIVVTPAALEGIEAVPGRDLSVAETAPDFASMIASAFLGTSVQMGAAARALVNLRYGWEAHLPSIDRALENNPARGIVSHPPAGSEAVTLAG